MTIQADQLRTLIREVLEILAEDSQIPTLYSEDAVELLMLTAAQESLCGTFIKQVNGPALGIFQIEPSSYLDLYKWMARRPNLHKAVMKFRAKRISVRNNLIGNIPFQIVVARAFYYRKPGKLPVHTDLNEMAAYYKQYFNTHLGDATVEGAKEKYLKYGNN